MFDVRFLPNPHFVEHLRAGSGNDQAVVDYVLASHVTQDFLKRCFEFIDFLLPHYEREGRPISPSHSGVQVVVIAR